MAQTQVTNQIAASALRGEDVTITLNQTQIAVLTTLALNTKVTVSSSGNVGHVSEVDALGRWFYAKPNNPDGNMASNTPGILQPAEIITLG